jgi:hypothetical protein
MTSAQIAILNGLLAVETARRAKGGDARDRSAIVADILREVDMPDFNPALQRLARLAAPKRQRKPPAEKPSASL